MTPSIPKDKKGASISVSELRGILPKPKQSLSLKKIKEIIKKRGAGLRN